MPFLSADLRSNGDVSFCCDDWHNHPKLQGDTIIEKYNSLSAKLVRESILDGSYEYCDAEICPYLRNKNPRFFFPDDDVVKFSTNVPRFINFGDDDSCNLSCPSCRDDFITVNTNQLDYKEQVDEFAESVFVISTSTSGDPLYGKDSRDFLHSINKEKYPNLQKINIQTNGLLLKKHWDLIEHLKNICDVDLSISIDAATTDTYNIVRRGGNFRLLIENLTFINSQNISHVNFCFTVNQINFKEILKFYYLMEKTCNALNTTYNYTIIQQWQHMTDEQFLDMYPIGEEYDKFIELFKAELEKEIESGKIACNI